MAVDPRRSCWAVVRQGPQLDGDRRVPGRASAVVRRGAARRHRALRPCAGHGRVHGTRLVVQREPAGVCRLGQRGNHRWTSADQGDHRERRHVQLVSRRRGGEPRPRPVGQLELHRHDRRDRVRERRTRPERSRQGHRVPAAKVGPGRGGNADRSDHGESDTRRWRTGGRLARVRSGKRHGVWVHRNRRRTWVPERDLLDPDHHVHHHRSRQRGLLRPFRGCCGQWWSERPVGRHRRHSPPSGARYGVDAVVARRRRSHHALPRHQRAHLGRCRRRRRSMGRQVARGQRRRAEFRGPSTGARIGWSTADTDL